MTDRELAIQLANERIIGSIHKYLLLDGEIVLESWIQDLLNGSTVPFISDRIRKYVENTAKAWEYVLEHLDERVTPLYLNKLHDIVGDGIFYNHGEFRKTSKAATGAIFRLPCTVDITTGVFDLFDLVTDYKLLAFMQFTYIYYAMPYDAGNVVIGSLVASKTLINHGVGMFYPIEERTVDKLREKLKEYLETHNPTGVYTFFKEDCVLYKIKL